MQKLMYALVLSIVLLQMFLLPAVAQAQGCEVSVTIADTTLPVTDITSTTAVFNGRVFESIILPFHVRPSSQFEIPQAFEYGTTRGVYTKTINGEIVSVNFTETPYGADGILFKITYIFRARVENLDPCSTYYVRSKVIGELVSTAVAGNIGMSAHQVAGDGGFCLLVNSAKEVTFNTLGCGIGPGQGGLGTSSSASVIPQGPVQMANIIVHGASIGASKVGPGESVAVRASVTNRGTVNGDARLSLYVNGEEVESRGVTVSSGQTAPVQFQVSRNEPGVYSVYVNGVSAGSFTVDALANNEILIYALIALFLAGIAATLYLVTRKRSA